jgi:hypothetical protein
MTAQPGCHIPTMDHVITADSLNDIEIHSNWLDWTMTLAQLFEHNNTKQITQLVTNIQSTVTGAFNASKLLQQWNELDKPFQSAHWLFSSPAARIGMVLLFSLLLFAIWKKCCAKPSPYTPAFPTPSALALPTSNQPSTNGVHSTPMNFNLSAAPKTITIINS